MGYSVVHFTRPVFPYFEVDHFVVRTPHVRGAHRHSWARAEPREHKKARMVPRAIGCYKDATRCERRNCLRIFVYFCQDMAGSDQAHPSSLYGIPQVTKYQGF